LHRKKSNSTLHLTFLTLTKKTDPVPDRQEISGTTITKPHLIILLITIRSQFVCYTNKCDTNHYGTLDETKFTYAEVLK